MTKLGDAKTVRLQYADLHGVMRGKDIPAAQFEHAVEDRVNFVAAVMTTDLRHNVVSGFETGFEDIAARPDTSTLVPIPWEPQVSACLVDLERVHGGPYPVDPRGALKRV